MTSRLPRRPWYLVAANGQKDVLLWDLKPSAEHGFEVGLTTALSKASHLSSAGHLYAQHHVSTRQAGEGELRHLGEQQDQCREKRQQRGPVPITPAQQGWPSLSPACPHHPGAARLAFPEPCCVHTASTLFPGPNTAPRRSVNPTTVPFLRLSPIPPLLPSFPRAPFWKQRRPSLNSLYIWFVT